MDELRCHMIFIYLLFLFSFSGFYWSNDNQNISHKISLLSEELSSIHGIPCGIKKFVIDLCVCGFWILFYLSVTNKLRCWTSLNVPKTISAATSRLFSHWCRDIYFFFFFPSLFGESQNIDVIHNIIWKHTLNPCIT